MKDDDAKNPKRLLFAGIFWPRVALPGREDAAEWLQLAAAAGAVIMWNGNIWSSGTGRSTNNFSRQ